jgi:hypothetical protein
LSGFRGEASGREEAGGWVVEIWVGYSFSLALFSPSTTRVVIGTVNIAVGVMAAVTR